MASAAGDGGEKKNVLMTTTFTNRQSKLFAAAIPFANLIIDTGRGSLSIRVAYTQNKPSIEHIQCSPAILLVSRYTTRVSPAGSYCLYSQCAALALSPFIIIGGFEAMSSFDVFVKK
jgi:hypothetical protein